jgi:hypothetical protein
MNDTDRLERFRGRFHTGEIPITTPDCFDAGMIAALADGTLPVDARAHALRHLASCALCRRAVASVAEALADEPITHEIEVVEGRTNRWRRVLRIGVPLAAAATVLVLLWSPANDSPSPHRGGPGQGAAPSPVVPRGTVDRAQRLVWTGLPGSDRYRVTLFAAQGIVVYETELADTAVVLPDSLRFLSGQPYLWKVEARTGWNRWVTSDLVEFTIARAPPQ